MADNRNLGEGSVGRLLVKLAIPAIISQVVNMLYNIVDRMYIGHIEGEGLMALTGLGICFPIIMLISAFSALVGMGGAPRAAIAMGGNDNSSAEKILGNCVSSLVAISVVLTAIFAVFGKDMLFLFGASENTIGYAWSYLQIYAAGTIFVQMALGLNMFITTQGFTTYSMLTVVIGAVSNIILDPVLIFGLDMGVQGAATATVVSQAISSVWVIKFLTGKKTKLKIKKKNLKLEAKILFPIFALGISPFVMQSTESIMNICFNTSLQKYGGDVAVGAMTILGSVLQLCTMPLHGMTQGAQPIISFNYGAGKMDRVMKAVRLQIGACVLFTFVMWGMAELFPKMFISIFNNNAELVDTAVWAMRIYMAGMFMMGFQIGCQQVFVALGQAKISLFLAVLRKLILLIPLIYILPLLFQDKVFAIFLAEPVADITAATITFLVFLVRIRQIISKKKV